MNELSEAINLACYIYDADFRGLEKLLNVGVEKALAESV